jgi:adenylylsulfate kinase-like enzyme
VVQVLWLCGPPGVGKTAVGWEIYCDLKRMGLAAGYVDIDQLGMCYPERASDPERHRLKARNLGAVVARFRQAGARCLVVSGVVDPGRAVSVDSLPSDALTVCRLRARAQDLKERLAGRRSDADVASVLREAELMDASDVAAACVDTTGRSVAEVVQLVRARTGGWPVLGSPSRSTAVATPAFVSTVDGAVLWLCGARGVGKSTVGFASYLKTLNAGRAAAYLDLDQIAFCNLVPPDSPRHHHLKADLLAALWEKLPRGRSRMPNHGRPCRRPSRGPDLPHDAARSEHHSVPPSRPT